MAPRDATAFDAFSVVFGLVSVAFPNFLYNTIGFGLINILYAFILNLAGRVRLGGEYGTMVIRAIVCGFFDSWKALFGFNAFGVTSSGKPPQIPG